MGSKQTIGRIRNVLVELLQEFCMIPLGNVERECLLSYLSVYIPPFFHSSHHHFTIAFFTMAFLFD